MVRLLTLRNTFLYAIGSLVFIPPLALGIALLLNARVRLQWLWRTLYFTPVVTSTVAVATILGSWVATGTSWPCPFPPLPALPPFPPLPPFSRGIVIRIGGFLLRPRCFGNIAQIDSYARPR